MNLKSVTTWHGRPARVLRPNHGRAAHATAFWKPLLGVILLLGVASTSHAAAPPPTSQPVPPILGPLQAKITLRDYQFKGAVLSFRTDQPITDEQWKAIDALNIHNVRCGGKGVDDAAIARLVKLDLEGLGLDGAVITDEACKSIAEMKSLRILGVGHTVLGKNGFTGSGFAYLKSLPKLEKIGFGGTTGGDEAMNAIGEITQLKEFSSWHTHFTTASNGAFRKLVNLTKLTIGNSMPAWNGKPRQLSLTDSTLDDISQMPALEDLTLMQASFTLPALEKLKALPKLKTLKFDNVNVEPADIQKLRTELPNVKITYSPLTDDQKTKLQDFLTHK